MMDGFANIACGAGAASDEGEASVDSGSRLEAGGALALSRSGESCAAVSPGQGGDAATSLHTMTGAAPPPAERCRADGPELANGVARIGGGDRVSTVPSVLDAPGLISLPSLRAIAGVPQAMPLLVDPPVGAALSRQPGAALCVRFAIIIPARAGSTRYPGKPLALLRGAGGLAKPLIQRTWECGVAVAGTAGVWVATDDEAIAQVVRGFGGQVVMTSSACRNGTERCAEAVTQLGLDVDIVVNLQGDAPLTPGPVVAELVATLAADEQAAMATAALECSAATYAHLQDDAAIGRAGGTTVVTNGRGYALYFSKAVMPFVPRVAVAGVARAHEAVRLHLGLYAYRPSALAAYAAMPPSPLEELEGLEQLRFLEGEAPVRVVSFSAPAWDCIELNNPEDVAVIEANLALRGIE